MADSKSGMNLPSRTSLVISDLKTGISGMRQETSLLNQEWSSLVQKMGTGAQKMSGGGGLVPGGGYGGNKVAPDPVFNNSSPSSGNVIAAGPSQPMNGGGGFGGGGGGGGGGGTTGGAGGNMFRNLSEFISNNKTGSALYGMGTALGAAQATSDMVEAQLLMQRTAANMPRDPGMTLDQGLFGTGGGSRYEYARRSATQMAMMGQANSQMDAFNAMTAAQSYGLTGTNYLQNKNNPSMFEGSIAAQVANVSNLTPGIGLEGMTRAAGGMQRGRNVNMLKGVGITVRDGNGNMKGPEEIIDEIWKKICRDYAGAYGSGKTPSEREIQIGFQQGNSMDQLVQNLFGDDPLIYMTIKNGLIYKAKTGGAAITKEGVTAAGMTTEAVNTFGKKQALGTQQLGQVSNFGAGAYTLTQGGLNFVTAGLNATDAAAGPLGGPLKMLNGVAAVLQTLGGAAGGTGSKLMQFLMAMLGLSGKAEGGPVNDKQPYIVGEKGPELFVPKTNGTIVPNHELGPFRHHGGGVQAGGVSMTKGEWAKALLGKLGAPASKENTAAIQQWMAEEGGHWNNSAGYNPLNTTYSMKGASLMDSGPGRAAGVKHYTDWAQGLNATVNTLTGNQAEQRGYTKIISLLKSGASKEEIHKAILASSWGTGGGSGSATAEGSTDTAVLDAKGTAAITKYLGKDVAAAYQNYLKTGDIGNVSIASLVGGGAAGAGIAGTLGGAVTNNYGGVTFNMNVMGGDPKTLESLFKKWANALKTGNVVSGS